MDNPQVTALDLTDNRFTEVPASLARMARLQVLDLSGNPLQSLPDRTMLPLDNAPDWRHFPALRELDLSLDRRWSAGSADLPLLRALADLPDALTDLTLDHWSAFEPEVIKAIIALPHMLGRLVNLRRLSLVRTRIDVGLLFDVLPNLKALEQLDIEGIPLSRRQRRQLDKCCPAGCEILD